MAAKGGSTWESMTWKRRLETSGPNGRSIPARGAGGETSGIWYVRLTVSGRDSTAHFLTVFYSMPGELTDKGRETSLAFGEWLRQLYVDQLGLVTFPHDFAA